MQFHTLSLKNIGNHTSLKCDFSGKNIFAITGKSRAGKSTIMESLFYALTGTTHKMGGKATLNTGQHSLKKLGTNEASIQLTFSIGGMKYSVHRTTNGSSLTIEGKSLTDDKMITETILSFMNLTVSQLRYVLFLGQGDVDSLLKAKPSEVSNIVVQDILNTEILTRMHTDLNSQEVKLSKDEARIDGAIQTLEKQYNEATSKREYLVMYPPSYFLPFKGKKEPWLSCSEDIQRHVSSFLREILNLEKEQTKQESQLDGLNKELIPLNILQNLEKLKNHKDAIIQNLRLQIYQTTQLDFQKKRELESLLSNLIQNNLSIQDLKDSQKDWKEAQIDIEAISLIIQNEQTILKGLEAEKLSKQGLYQQAEKNFLQQKNSITNNNYELKKLVTNTTSLKAKILQFQKKISNTEESKQALSQTLISEQSSLLNRTVQYVQLHIIDNDKDSCPVCEQKISHITSVQDPSEPPSQKDFSNIKKLQADLQQRESTLVQLNGNIEAFKIQLQETEEKQAGLRVLITEDEKDLKAFEDKFNIQKVEFESFNTTIKSQLKLLETKKQQHLKLSKKTVTYSWLQRDSEGIFQSLKTFIDYSAQWKQVVSSLTGQQSLSLFQSQTPRLFDNIPKSFQAQLEINIKIHSSNDSQVINNIEQLNNKITEKRAELSLYWQNFVLSNPEWSNLITPSTLSIEKWNELKEALSLFEKSRLSTQRLNEKRKEKTKIVDQRTRVATIASHFGTSKSSLKEYLSSQLYKELCAISNPFLRTFIGKVCSVSYEKGFYLEQNNQKLPSKALSGGERFYVALALAFGLREYLLKKSNVELKTIFIDEGFHMIKGISIDDLLGKLQTLSKDNNIGFITHNDELIAKVPQRLQVSPSSVIWMSNEADTL